MTNASFWDKVAEKYAKDSIGDMEAYEQTRDRMRDILQPHHRVLEIGCGTGSTALELADCVDRYVGTDLSLKMIAIAQSKLSSETPDNLRFAVHDAEMVPSGTHDVILALNLFHLLPDLEDVLAQLFDALPTGGMLISKTSLLGDGLWVIPWVVPIARLFGKAPYVRSLGDAEMLDLLRGAGFTVTETISQAGTVPRLFCVATKP